MTTRPLCVRFLLLNVHCYAQMNEWDHSAINPTGTSQLNQQHQRFINIVIGLHFPTDHGQKLNEVSPVTVIEKNKNTSFYASNEPCAYLLYLLEWLQNAQYN